MPVTYPPPMPSTSVITRDGDNLITSVSYENGKILTINRTGQLITSVEDSFRGTFTINRNVDNTITGVTYIP